MDSYPTCAAKQKLRLFFLGLLSVGVLHTLPTVTATELSTQTQQNIEASLTALDNLTQQAFSFIPQGNAGESLDILDNAEQLAKQTLVTFTQLSSSDTQRQLGWGLHLKLSEIYAYQAMALKQVSAYAKTAGEDGTALRLQEQTLSLYRKALSARQESKRLINDRSVTINDTLAEQLAENIIALALEYRRHGREQHAAPLLEEVRLMLSSIENSTMSSINGVAFNLTSSQIIDLKKSLAFAYQEEGTNLQIHGNFQQAESLLNEALALAQQAESTSYTQMADILSTLGYVYHAQAQRKKSKELLNQAEQYYQRSIALYQQHQNTTIAVPLDLLATLYFQRGVEGEPDYFKKSIALQLQVISIEENELTKPTETASNSLPLAAIKLTQQDQQKSLYARRIQLARTYIAIGQYSEAIPYMTKNLDDPNNNLPPAVSGSKANSLDILATLERKTGEYTQSLDTLDAIYSMFAAYHGSYIRHEAGLQALALVNLATINEGLTKKKLQMIDILPQAFRAMQLAHGTSRLQAFHQIALRLATQNTTNTDNLQKQIQQTNAKIQQQEQALQTSFPAYAKLTHPEPLTIPQAQALLQPDEALMVWIENTVDAEKYHFTVNSFLMVIRHDRPPTYHALPIDQTQITQQVDALRKALTLQKKQTQPGAFNLTTAHELYQAIFAAAEPDLVDIKHIIAVQDSGMHNLPLHALVKTAPTNTNVPSNADYTQADWLVNHYSFSYLPSVHALADLRQPSAAQTNTSTQPFIGMGDPILQGKPATERSLRAVSKSPQGDQFSVYDTDKIREFNSLPETADELQSIAKHLNADPKTALYLQERATETLLKTLSQQGKLATSRIISFATHAWLPHNDNTEAGLVLTPPARGTPEDDGYLTASEVASLKLDNTAWVMLSACDTGTLTASDAPKGLSALSDAFFKAGAHSVFASLWPVNSQTTTQLTPNLFDKLQANPKLRRDEALQQAMLDAIDAGCGWRCRFGFSESYHASHPIYWAPFVIYGEGGAIH